MTLTSCSPLSWSGAGPDSACTTVYILCFPAANTHTHIYFLLFFPPPLTISFSIPSLAATHLLHLSQGYEDWLRHKADCSINECPVDVVQQGKVVRTQSHKLRVRMASLEQHSTWGHKATPLFCCIAHFFFPVTVALTTPPLSLPLCSPLELSFLLLLLSLHFPTN